MGAIVKYEFNELMSLGQVLAKSGMFQDARQEAQAVVKVLAGAELGFGAVASMTGVHVIKGRVTLSANLIAAAIKRSGKYTYRVAQLDDNTCALHFFEWQGEQWEDIGASVFNLQDAKKAGLSGDNWTKYPRNMLFARALSNGAKWYCPDIFGGPIYTPEELGAEVDEETGELTEPTVVVEAPIEPAPPTFEDVLAFGRSLRFTDKKTKEVLKEEGFNSYKPAYYEQMISVLHAEADALQVEAERAEMELAQ